MAITLLASKRAKVAVNLVITLKTAFTKLLIADESRLFYKKASVVQFQKPRSDVVQQSMNTTEGAPRKQNATVQIVMRLLVQNLYNNNTIQIFPLFRSLDGGYCARYYVQVDRA